jgi:hypothetical protein
MLSIRFGWQWTVPKSKRTSLLQENGKDLGVMALIKDMSSQIHCLQRQIRLSDL